MSTSKRMTLPTEQCDECGAPIKWVRNLKTRTRIPIDAEPAGCMNPRALYARVMPNDADGAIDCVMIPVGEVERCGRTYLYVPHRDTCPNPNAWRGKKKRNRLEAALPPRQPDGRIPAREETDFSLAPIWRDDGA